MHTDMFKRPLSVGDKVYHLYKGNLIEHTIVRFTSTQIVGYVSSPSNTYRMAPHKVIYIEDQLKANHQTFPERYV